MCGAWRVERSGEEWSNWWSSWGTHGVFAEKLTHSVRTLLVGYHRRQVQLDLEHMVHCRLANANANREQRIAVSVEYGVLESGGGSVKGR